MPKANRSDPHDSPVIITKVGTPRAAGSIPEPIAMLALQAWMTKQGIGDRAIVDFERQKSGAFFASIAASPTDDWPLDFKEVKISVDGTVSER